MVLRGYDAANNGGMIKGVHRNRRVAQPSYSNPSFSSHHHRLNIALFAINTHHPVILVPGNITIQSMVTSKKGLKIGRALRSAARLPIRVSAGRGSGRNSFLPIPGEAPIVILRVRVLSCQDLVAKDRSGLSDPWVPLYPSLFPLTFDAIIPIFILIIAL